MNDITLPTLFRKDSKGKPRQWSVVFKGDQVIVSHGMVGGKIVDKAITCKAKNIGKSNETTPEQQAISEAKSKWTKQIDREDYNVNIDMAGLQLRPMLALDYNKVPHRVKWDNVYAQPKLDGLRLTVGNRMVPNGYTPGEFEMLTRKGETYDVEHLVKPCLDLLTKVNELCDNKCLALDGEIYVHGMPLQEIVSYAKKYKKGKTELLEFHLFDLVIPGMPCDDRYEILAKAMLDNKQMVLVPCFDIANEEDMKELHGKFTEAGYEGLMIRHNDSEYAIGQRSPDLFKYKHFFDKECKIIGMFKDNNGNAMLTCLWDHTNPDTEFGCTPKRTHEVRKEMLNNQEEILGQWITVKYQGLTNKGKPQFPVGLAIRECDDDGNPIV